MYWLNLAAVPVNVAVPEDSVADLLVAPEDRVVLAVDAVDVVDATG